MGLARALPIVALAALAPACGPGRTSAATQSMPKAFDPAASDAKAVALVDQAVAAHGGEKAWLAAKEIHWTQAVVVDGAVVDIVDHVWDRWNGRHSYTHHEKGGSSYSVGYDVYEGTGFASIINEDGADVEANSEQKKSMMAEAKKRLWEDSYRVVLPFKLKDPGVHLKYLEERGEVVENPAPDAPPPPPKWDVVGVSFDAGVGPEASVYEIYIGKDSHLIEQIDRIKEVGGQKSAIGYRIEEWTTVAGLKLGARWSNMGFMKSPQVALTVPPPWADEIPPGLQAPNPGETLIFLKMSASGDPDDNLYIPKVK